VERENIVTVHGNPVTLIGPALKVGDKAPDFTVVDTDLKEVNLKQFAAKIKIISVTTSLDTPVCDKQTKKFNEEMTEFPEKIAVLNISMDLPFAIKRFSQTACIEKMHLLSDHRDASFGSAYGVLIKELRLLARSIFLIDQENIIRYIQIVPETTNPPDLTKAFDAVGKLLESYRQPVS